MAHQQEVQVGGGGTENLGTLQLALICIHSSIIQQLRTKHCLRGQAANGELQHGASFLGEFFNSHYDEDYKEVIRLNSIHSGF